MLELASRILNIDGDIWLYYVWFFLQTNGKFGVVNGHKQMKSNERMDEKKTKNIKHQQRNMNKS